MSWYKDKKLFARLMVLCLIFLLEGFLFSAFISISNVKSMDSFLVLSMFFWSALAFALMNTLALVFVATIASIKRGRLKNFAIRVGVINFTLIYLLVPMFITTYLWSFVSIWIIGKLGGIAYISNSVLFPIFLLNIIIFYTAIFFTSKI